VLNFTAFKDEPNDPPEGAEYESFNNLVFAPEFTYFVINGLAVGGRLSYATHPSEDADYSMFGLYALVRYYLRIAKGMPLFFTAGLDLGYQTTSTGEDSSDSGFVLGPKVGLTLSFGARAGGFASLLAGLDYAMLTADTGSAEYDHTQMVIGIGTLFGIFF